MRTCTELRANAATLQARSEMIELLGGMSHRMQTARTDSELAAVIQCFVPRILPSVPGALRAQPFAQSADAARELGFVQEAFSPEQC